MTRPGLGWGSSAPRISGSMRPAGFLGPQRHDQASVNSSHAMVRTTEFERGLLEKAKYLEKFSVQIG